MKLVALNLRQGGGHRVVALGDYLLGSNADILICPEYKSTGPSASLASRLQAAGYLTFEAARLPDRALGLAVFARPEAEIVALDFPAEDPNRICAIRIGELCIIGVYFGQELQKRTLFNYLLSKPETIGPETLIAGDFNTGRHWIDEAGATFKCAKEFARLSDIGLVDLWRMQHGDGAREFSWFSNRRNGLRLDHAFATDGLTSRVVDCRYDHSTLGVLSDHSALIVEFEPV